MALRFGTRTALATLGLVSLSLACGDDTSVVVSTSEDEPGTSSESEDSADSDEGETSGGEDETSTETGEPPPPPELGGPAAGISIIAVEANQGTGVSVSVGEDWIEPDARNAYLVHGRDTMVRFQHTILDPEAWIPRDLSAFLHIYPPNGGEELIRERTFFVSGDSDPRDLSTNFFFSVVAEEAVPGTRFWIELRESDAAIDVSGLSEGVTSSPAEPELFGFEETDLELEVMLIPVDYQWPDPPRYPDITEEDLTLFHDYLLQQNPVQEVKFEIRSEPLVRNQRVTNLGSLLEPTRNLKVQDGAAPNVYYHSLIDVGGPSVNMVAGIANLAGPGMGEGFWRVAATVYYKHVDPGDEEEGEEPQVFSPAASARTFVHEVGHNQGLSHVYCPGGNSAGDDPNYPHMDGHIGVFGFGIRDFHIYSPQHAHDYMSYCGNAWVSDWTWNKTFVRIAELTSWNQGNAPAPDPGASGAVLVGTLFADGSEQWWVHEIPVQVQPSGAQRLELWRDGQLLGHSYAQVELLSDGQTVQLRAPLPSAQLELDAIVRVDALGERHPIAPAQIQFAHAP